MRLFRAVADGGVADYGANPDEEHDCGSVREGGQERTIQADRISWLFTSPEALRRVTSRGVQVAGARVEGNLDLSFATVSFPLALTQSTISAGISLYHASIGALNLNCTHVGPF